MRVALPARSATRRVMFHVTVARHAHKDWIMLERRTDWLKRAQFDEVRSQITERLPHLRNRMAVDEFDQVVRTLTLVRLKCEVNRVARIPDAQAASNGDGRVVLSPQ